ncbi:hypothetical protein J2S43_002846 [Catenuloplanes nepalensis]|uniref:Uncharacterized protein n=1 Tax=Catenuloplanes nepalensis TaxID=587533 RepID=A0ABT9MSB6_9ACTN|nr:hypothetical protein [Catenuloplanes nepalensis]MDP9794334.1 hypothetical protein [Catenuloplanes nepalensis]
MTTVTVIAEPGVFDAWGAARLVGEELRRRDLLARSAGDTLEHHQLPVVRAGRA